ncbi:TetR/AcrR family transcriptional regulator [Gordonia sp. NPDC003424]
MPNPTKATVVRRRPKDRKGQIVDSARVLFFDHGFPNVSMAQIAESVGITAGALYRHFANKRVMLTAVIEQSIDDLDASTDLDDDLVAHINQASTAAVVRRDTGALWWRESRYLDAADHDRLARRLNDNNRSLAQRICATRTTLSEPQAKVLAYGVQAALASPSFHHTSLPPAESAALLAKSCLAIAAVELGSPHPLPNPDAAHHLAPVSKREALLMHAIRLFDRDGFEATSLSDIGTAAGVTGPNLYSYFESKGDVLDAAIERGVNALWLLLYRVLRENVTARGVLSDLVSGYLGLILDGTVLNTALLTDRTSLSPEMLARQREYVIEWVALLRASRPEFDERSARVLVHTALTVIQIVSRVATVRANSAVVDDIAAMARAVLFVPDNSGQLPAQKLT